MGRTAYRFWFEPSTHVERCGDRWTATEIGLGLVAQGDTEDEARRRLSALTDDLIASLASKGVDALEAHFSQRSVKCSFIPVAARARPAADDDEDLMPLEELRARYGRA